MTILKDFFCENESFFDDVLESNVSGAVYTDDELRGKYREGLAVLENNGDYDAVMSYAIGDIEAVRMTMWKALDVAGVIPDNLTGRQLLHLYDVLKGKEK